MPARAGDAIIFSSLSPHRTGPNLKTGTVRKAYILQYCPRRLDRDPPRRPHGPAGPSRAAVQDPVCVALELALNTAHPREKGRRAGVGGSAPSATSGSCGSRFCAKRRARELRETDAWQAFPPTSAQRSGTPCTGCSPTARARRTCGRRWRRKPATTRRSGRSSPRWALRASSSMRRTAASGAGPLELERVMEEAGAALLCSAARGLQRAGRRTAPRAGRRRGELAPAARDRRRNDASPQPR